MLESVGMKKSNTGKARQRQPPRLERAMVELRDEVRTGFASVRREFGAVRHEIGDVRQEVGTLRQDMVDGFAAVHREFAAVCSEMDNGFAAVRGDTDNGFAAVRGEMAAGFAAVRQEAARDLVDVRNDIRQGDQETRVQLGVLIESLHDDVRIALEAHIDLEQRVRRLEDRR